MNRYHELELQGCTPEPLMAYLKALGIFRLVSEQKDATARARWQHDGFFLRSALDRDGLVAFFLEEYRPTPIVSPWNGGSGFYPKDNAKAIETIEEQDSPRFRLWQEAVAEGRQVLAQSRKLQGAEKKDPKRWILAQCRNRFPDDALAWLDAAYVLTSGGAKYPPLLGTGGNDGRLEFSNNFMQNIVLALNLGQRRHGEAAGRSQLVSALFNEDSPQLVRKRSSGFYNPSSVGGANASVGFNDEALTNPWDYILMFEGTLLFAGAAARRLSAQSSTKAVFPFTVDNSAAGYGTSTDSEYGNPSRAEFWAPLWDRPASLQELRQLVSEGRAQLGRRQVSSGVDFARAVAGLGTERGVSGFQRYGFLVRNGLAYLAAPLGRLYVQADTVRAQRANVLFDLDIWMERLRSSAASSGAPAGLGPVLRRIESAVFEFCQRGDASGLQNVLIAVGHAQRWLSKSGLRKESDRGRGVPPLHSLSHSWLESADDGSAEFRLACALASIRHEQAPGERRVGPIRENMEPVDIGGRTGWKEDSVSFVWTAGDALANMLAVLERRCLEGRMQSLKDAHTPLNSANPARLDDIAAFVAGSVDAQRVVELALPLSFVRYWPHAKADVSRQAAPDFLPVAYTAMKLTLLPGKFEWPKHDISVEIRMEPKMVALLRAGRMMEAYQVARRRLWASGLSSLLAQPGIADRSACGYRLAAALLFPLDRSSYSALAEHALMVPRQT